MQAHPGNMWEVYRLHARIFCVDAITFSGGRTRTLSYTSDERHTLAMLGTTTDTTRSGFIRAVKNRGSRTAPSFNPCSRRAAGDDQCARADLFSAADVRICRRGSTQPRSRDSSICWVRCGRRRAGARNGVRAHPPVYTGVGF